MSLKIIKAGLLDTLQDGGRFGYQQLGINPTGAMDKYAMQVANILVGNAREEAVIEMHFPAAVFMFMQPALIALSGANFAPRINGEAVPSLQPLLVAKNDLLQFHQPLQGASAYLAVAGGLAIDKWLNSYSTNLKAGAGGYRGRKLQQDDEILLRNPGLFSQEEKAVTLLPWKADTNWNQEDGDILFLPGNEWEMLTSESKEKLSNSSFAIAPQSDRMGYRLNNVPLQRSASEEIVSSAVSFGTVQLLPDGSLIILMADHQTTGGYPRIAHVISAHHSKLPQRKAGDSIRFKLTGQATAEKLYIKQQQHLLQLQNACTFRLEEYFHGNRYKL